MTLRTGDRRESSSLCRQIRLSGLAWMGGMGQNQAKEAGVEAGTRYAKRRIPKTLPSRFFLERAER
jgi:hypothetical protein